MAQAQLMFNEETLSYFKQCGFEDVTWSPIRKEIICVLNDDFSIMMKKRRSHIKLFLKKGKSKILLPQKLFENLCDLKESVQLISSFLEGHST